jgi:hypothetical protein
MTWECRVCTYLNEENDGNASTCTMCDTPRRSTRTEHGSVNKSICLKDVFHSSALNSDSVGSLSKLSNMSFAAWESDRKPWKCKTCTFDNGPRYLLCGGCGMAEGATNVVEDELIALGLQQMSLNSAQEYLTKIIHTELDKDREDKLRKERLVELLDEEIKLASRDSQLEQQENEKRQKLIKHIETLARLQNAELEEHDNMSFTIELWRDKLKHEPNEAEQKQLVEQEELLAKLIGEWNERDKEIEEMKLMLEGNRASI